MLTNGVQSSSSFARQSSAHSQLLPGSICYLQPSPKKLTEKFPSIQEISALIYLCVTWYYANAKVKKKKKKSIAKSMLFYVAALLEGKLLTRFIMHQTDIQVLSFDRNLSIPKLIYLWSKIHKYSHYQFLFIYYERNLFSIQI